MTSFWTLWRAGLATYLGDILAQSLWANLSPFTLTHFTCYMLDTSGNRINMLPATQTSGSSRCASLWTWACENDSSVFSPLLSVGTRRPDHRLLLALKWKSQSVPSPVLLSVNSNLVFVSQRGESHQGWVWTEEFIELCVCVCVLIICAKS